MQILTPCTTPSWMSACQFLVCSYAIMNAIGVLLLITGTFAKVLSGTAGLATNGTGSEGQIVATTA